MKSEAEMLAALPVEEQEKFYKSLTNKEAEALNYSWEFFARPNQLAPPGKWKSWLILAGRGFGKTRAGAEWVRQMVCGDSPLAKGRCRRVALIGETAKDVRDVMVEGDSGILGVHPKDYRPLYEPSKARLTWPNGAEATMYNATEPDQLRGPQFDCAWLDELAKWDRAQESYDMLQFGLRLGSDPRQIITTTPRPVPLVKMLIADPTCVVTKGSTYDNMANLAPSFIDEIKKRYEGTRLGRQELHADVLLDNPGSLWKSEMIERNRVDHDKVPPLKRIVVAVDPAVSDPKEATEDMSETGIICAGLDEKDEIYVLADGSCREMPEGWARKAIALFDLHQADRIVCETNQGGVMVEQTVRAVRDVSFQGVKASRGKITRAEPVSALYEQNRVHHVGQFSVLEDQMLQFIPGNKLVADRVDALVWACTSLLPTTVLRTSGDEDFSGDMWDIGRNYNDFGFYRK